MDPIGSRKAVKGIENSIHEFHLRAAGEHE